MDSENTMITEFREEIKSGKCKKRKRNNQQVEESMG